MVRRIVTFVLSKKLMFTMTSLHNSAKYRTILILSFLLIYLNRSDNYFQSRAVLFNNTGIGPEERLAVMNLAGIVNQDSSRLYLMNVYETWSYNRTDETWASIYMERGNVQFDTISTLAGLFSRFGSSIAGAVTYDPNRYYSNFSGQSFLWQGEYAVILASLTGRIAFSAAKAQYYGLALSDSVLVEDEFDGDAPVMLPARLENSGLPWNISGMTEEARYLKIVEWGIANLLPRCNPEKFYIREITDFTAAKKMFQVNFAGTGSLDFNSLSTQKADLLEQILTYYSDKNPGSIFHIYGWMHPEPLIQWFAFFGASFHETLLGNLSWHSAFPSDDYIYSPPVVLNPDSINIESKYYVTFVGTEGDASNWVIGLQSGAWLSAERGDIPINWGWNLHLFDEMPFLAKYYYETATGKDGFLAVTSPLGYFYPDLLPADKIIPAQEETRRLMDKFSMRNMYGYKHYAPNGYITYRGKGISNSYNFVRYGEFQTAADCDLTFVFDPQLISQRAVIRSGALFFNHTGDNSFYGDVSDLDAAASRIITNIKKQNKPGFLLAGYQRLRQDDFQNRSDPSDADISLPRLKLLMDKIKADPAAGPYVEFVTAELFSALLRKQSGLSAEQENIPASYTLMSNYPNPFNSMTRILINVPESGEYLLTLYDMLGRIVKEVYKGNLQNGESFLLLDAGDLNSGAFVLSLVDEKGGRLNRKILHLK